MAFDPCREWLGIDAVDLDAPHLVLGLTAGETDPVAVGRAAAERLAILRGLAPGPFVVARDALLKRVEEARDTLLSSLPPPRLANAAGANAAPAGGVTGAWRSTAPTSSSAARAAGAFAAAPATAAGWTVSGPETGHPVPAFEIGGAPRSSLRPHGPPPARPAASGASFAAMALLLATATGLGGFWYASQRVDRQVASRDADPSLRRSERKDPERERPTRPREEPTEPKRPNPRPRAGETPQPEPQPAPPPAPRPQPPEGSPGIDEAAAARAAAAIDAALRKAFTSITAKDFATASRTIKAAHGEAGDDPDLHQRLDRWNLFNEYARDFQRHAASALEAANAGRDYALGKTRVAVIESTPTMLVYKQAGEIKRVPRERIPPDVLLAIVGSWFAADGRAANHIFLGVHHLAQPRPNVVAARREWQTATNGGESMEVMMPLLDDPIITGAAAGR